MATEILEHSEFADGQEKELMKRILKLASENKDIIYVHTKIDPPWKFIKMGGPYDSDIGDAMRYMYGKI